MYHKLQITNYNDKELYSAMAFDITIYITHLHQVLLTYIRKMNLKKD